MCATKPAQKQVANPAASPLSITIPKMHLKNKLNDRPCYFARAREARKQRGDACLRIANAMLAAGDNAPRKPFVVTITRMGKRAIDEHDALPASAKNIVDGVADALGVNDGDKTAVTWKYRNLICDRYAVTIDIEGRL